MNQSPNPPRHDNIGKFSVMHVAVALAVSALTVNSASAQTAAAKPEAKSDDKLEAITVTAQRREEELQKVPVSITTLSAKDLEQKQIRRLDDMKFEIPNVVIEPATGTSTAAKIFMRGVGTDESLFSADPSVAIYLDDVYIPRMTGALFDMFDVSRIEVLRGPQGTLYGRNAPGGAIRYVTAKPTGAEKFEIEGRVGNFHRLDVRASVSTKLAEGVDATFGVMSKARDGYLKDITNGGMVNDEQIYGARGSLGFNLGGTRVTVAGDILRQRSGPQYASGIVDAGTAAQFNRPINNADGNLLTIETNLPPGQGRNDLDQSGVSIVTSTDWDSVEWRNIVATRQMDNTLFIDIDGAAVTRFHLFQDQRQSQSSYESQLISTGKGPLSWTGGFFYFKEQNDQPTRSDLIPAVLGPAATSYLSQTVKANALYGQADYRLTPVWKATFGARSSRESKDFSILSIRANGTEAFRATKSNTWTNTDWKFGIDGQLSKEVLAYASASTGFKSGGFNGRAASLAAFTTLKPETVKSYEIGLKTTLADGKWRFNINYFRNDYKDLQLTAFDANGASNLTNAASALIKGFEIETAAQITPNWQVNAHLGTLDGKYQDFSAANAATFSGKALKQAPKQQWGVGTNYRVKLDDGAVNFNAGIKRIGDHYHNLATSEIIKTKAYSLIDARLAYDAKGGKWSVGIWGKNLTNKLYYTGAFDIAGVGIADAFINVPRTYGVDLRYRFK